MKILVIGGTQFVGKHFVREALERGHELTLFNRGNRPAPEATTHIKGDRNSDLDLLKEGNWDAVFDPSAYFPRQVRELAEVLTGRVEHYTLISTISVYADQTVPHQDENATVIELADPTVEEVRGDTYGGLKVLCERALAEYFPGEKLVARPGLIVGPDDPTDRFSYWPVRVAKGGEVLAPTTPDMPVQWIDVRDFATWLVDSVEANLTGTFNGVSQADRFKIGELLQTAKQVSGSDANFTWVEEQFLLDFEVGPFMQLPLWIPGESIAFSRIDGSKAHESGLQIRPMEDTVKATLEWRRTISDRDWRAGLAADRERELLKAWHERKEEGSKVT